MGPQVAIHKGVGGFADRWIEYCAEHNLPHQIVNAYDSDIISQLASADAFLWHWSHENTGTCWCPVPSLQPPR